MNPDSTSQDLRQPNRPLIGCAGWSLRPEHAESFATEGTHLGRYAAELPAVEINSSFYRPHQRKTYVRWAATVPAGFRFAVKLPRTISHELRLYGAQDPLGRFLEECSGLGEKLGCVLVQLPPSLAYDHQLACDFFRLLRGCCGADIACEPRHGSWFTDDAEELFRNYRVARVAADPPIAPGGDQPAGWSDVQYYRRHGSPRVYYSNYEEAQLLELIGRLLLAANEGRRVWCIFDNTALGAATSNALFVNRRSNPMYRPRAAGQQLATSSTSPGKSTLKYDIVLMDKLQAHAERFFQSCAEVGKIAIELPRMVRGLRNVAGVREFVDVAQKGDSRGIGHRQ